MTEETQKAMDYIVSTIHNCEKMQGKFKEGSSQHTLLVNRLFALHLSLELMRQEGVSNVYGINALNQALPPILSIIRKTTKAQSKYDADTKQYRRFTPIIEAMQIAQAHLEAQIKKETGQNDVG